MTHIKNWKRVREMFNSYYERLSDDYARGGMDMWLARLEAADVAPRIDEIHIRVHWHKSRYGETNPRAEVTVYFDGPVCGVRSATSVGAVGGCGYDKRSAAVSEALSFAVKRSDGKLCRRAKSIALAALDRFVIEHGDRLWREYAIGQSPFPHLCIDGKGMSTFTHLFRQAGCRSREKVACPDFEVTYEEYDDIKFDDVYHVLRREGAK